MRDPPLLGDLPIAKASQIISDHLLAAVLAKPGTIVVVTGPNGSGKSTLIELMTPLEGASFERFYGGRQITFSSSETTETGDPIKSLLSNIRHATRTYNPWGEQHLKSVVKRLINRSSQNSLDALQLLRRGSRYEEAEFKFPIPAAQLSNVFKEGRLEVEFTMHEGRGHRPSGGEASGGKRVLVSLKREDAFRDAGSNTN